MICAPQYVFKINSKSIHIFAPFLPTCPRNIKFTRIKTASNKEAENLLKIIEWYATLYANHRLTIKAVLIYSEFETLREDLLNIVIHINPNSYSKHLVDTERQIRVIK